MMPRTKPKYNFIVEIDGHPEATQEEVHDLLMRHVLRAANNADIFDGLQITHYKDVALY